MTDEERTEHVMLLANVNLCLIGMVTTLRLLSDEPQVLRIAGIMAEEAERMKAHILERYSGAEAPTAPASEPA